MDGHGEQASSRKRRIAMALGKYLFNPPTRALFRLGVPMPGTVILETVGRKSGAPRRTPVTNGLDDDHEVFWIVAEHGCAAGYVRNIEANPRVRIKVGRRWRTGAAEVLAEDDPRERLQAIARLRRSARVNTRTVVAMGTYLLVLRVALDG